MRITAQLIDAVNDRHLWSETYDRELTDIFAIQEEIANAIVNALRDQLGSVQAAAPVTVHADTENVEAYQLYLKARELFIARRNLPESIRLFERVTQLDPNFARGWEGLAAVCRRFPELGDPRSGLHGAGEAGGQSRPGAGRDSCRCRGQCLATSCAPCRRWTGPGAWS